jgi:hypothetical protein
LQYGAFGEIKPPHSWHRAGVTSPDLNLVTVATPSAPTSNIKEKITTPTTSNPVTRPSTSATDTPATMIATASKLN